MTTVNPVNTLSVLSPVRAPEAKLAEAQITSEISQAELTTRQAPAANQVTQFQASVSLQGFYNPQPGGSQLDPETSDGLTLSSYAGNLDDRLGVLSGLFSSLISDGTFDLRAIGESDIRSLDAVIARIQGNNASGQGLASELGETLGNLSEFAANVADRVAKLGDDASPDLQGFSGLLNDIVRDGGLLQNAVANYNAGDISLSASPIDSVPAIPVTPAISAGGPVSIESDLAGQATDLQASFTNLLSSFTTSLSRGGGEVNLLDIDPVTRIGNIINAAVNTLSSDSAGGNLNGLSARVESALERVSGLNDRIQSYIKENGITESTAASVADKATITFAEQLNGFRDELANFSASLSTAANPQARPLPADTPVLQAADPIAIDQPVLQAANDVAEAGSGQIGQIASVIQNGFQQVIDAYIQQVSQGNASLLDASGLRNIFNDLSSPSTITTDSIAEARATLEAFQKSISQDSEAGKGLTELYDLVDGVKNSLIFLDNALA